MTTRKTAPIAGPLLIVDPAKARENLNWRHDTSPREMGRVDLATMRDASIGKGA